MYLDTVQNIGRGKSGVLDALAGGGKKADPKARAMLTRIDTEEAMRLGNQWYDRLAATLGRDNRAERIKELTKVDNELKVLKAATAAAAAKVAEGKDPEADKIAGKSLASVLVTLLLPATRQVHDAWSRAEQAQRNLYVAFAVAAYRREHGRYPAELGELVPCASRQCRRTFSPARTLCGAPPRTATCCTVSVSTARTKAAAGPTTNRPATICACACPWRPSRSRSPAPRRPRVRQQSSPGRPPHRRRWWQCRYPPPPTLALPAAG
jgi:hypothetical protein